MDLVQAGLVDLLERIRGLRDDYVHLWRCLRFVVHSPAMGAVADRQAARELGRPLTLELGELRILEMAVLSDLLVLDPACRVDEPSEDVWERLHRCAPWALVDALSAARAARASAHHPAEERGDEEGPSLSVVEIATIWLLDLAALRGEGYQEPRAGAGTTGYRRPEQVLEEAFGWPAGGRRVADVLPVVESAEARFLIAVAVRRRAPSRDGVDPRSDRHLAQSLRSFGTRSERLRRASGVLAIIRRSVNGWLGTLPPGFPALPPTHRQDREFLFGMQRDILRTGARRVAQLAEQLFPNRVGKLPPTPTIAFSEDVSSTVTFDGNRIAILCPLHFQDAPRFLLSILHECAHGFIPDVKDLHEPGAFAPWIQGPLHHAIFWLETTPGGPHRRDSAFDCVAELLADCMAIALGGPGLLPCLLLTTLSENQFSEVVEEQSLLNPLTRCCALLEAMKAVWPGETGETGGGLLWAAATHLSPFLDAYVKALHEVAWGQASLGESPRPAAEVVRAREQYAFHCAVLSPLTHFAAATLRGILAHAQSTDWVFQGEAPGDGARWGAFKTKLAKRTARALAGSDQAAEGRLRRSFRGALRLGALPAVRRSGSAGVGSCPAGGELALADGRAEHDFIVHNTLHLLWAEWFHELGEGRAVLHPGGHRDLHRLVQLNLCRGPAEGDGLESTKHPHYFGGGQPLTVTFLDNSPLGGTSERGPGSKTPDQLRDPLVGPARWYHVLGQFDFLTIQSPAAGEGLGDSSDPVRFGCCRDSPYYTRQQELHLLDPSCIRPAVPWNRKSLASRLDELVSENASEDASVFAFLHRVLFEQPSSKRAAAANRVALMCGQLERGGSVAVRGVLRCFTWAELGFWVEATDAPGKAVAALVGRGGRRRRAEAAQTHTLTLLRWTPPLDRVHTAIEDAIGDAPGQASAHLAALAGVLRSADPGVGHSVPPPPIRFAFRLSRPRGSAHLTAPGAVRQALDEINHALRPTESMKLVLADALGEEDFQGWLDVPELIPRLGVSGPVLDALRNAPQNRQAQVATALLLLYTLRTLANALGLVEITTQVMLPHE